MSIALKPALNYFLSFFIKWIDRMQEIAKNDSFKNN